MTRTAAHTLAKAEEIADAVLLPAAGDVDRADRLPRSHLDLLAAEGFYALAAPPSAGGVDRATLGRVVELLASGCLATAFVWLQHHHPVGAVAASQEPGVAQRWLDPLARGETRAGIALAGLRPGAGGVTVRREGDAYVLNGNVPWVTGWDQVDVVQVGAVDHTGLIHFLLMDAVASATLHASIQQLGAVQASRTATVQFAQHRVPAERLVGTAPRDQWLADEASGSMLNGFLALGVARRCLRLAGPSPLDAELTRCRAALLAADAGTTPAARAAASELAYRSAARVVVHLGSQSALADGPAQRLVREAAFLLVFGSRPAIKDRLLEVFG